MWLSLLIQVDLHHKDVETSSKLALMACEVCIPHEEQHKSLTKVQYKIHQMLCALICYTTGDMSSSQATAAPLSIRTLRAVSIVFSTFAFIFILIIH
jgi:hypothetical protein